MPLLLGDTLKMASYLPSIKSKSVHMRRWFSWGGVLASVVITRSRRRSIAANGLSSALREKLPPGPQQLLERWVVPQRFNEGVSMQS